MTVRLLVFGKDGQLGESIVRRATPNYDVLALGRRDVDLGDAAAIDRAIKEFRPDFVLNAAAYTAVDAAEDEPDLAFAVNESAPRQMATSLDDCGGTLIHFSTDYVFDGEANRPYKEDAPTAPLGVYGQSKLAGEEAIRSATDRFFVLRTSWVYAPRGKNFLKTMMALGRARESLSVVSDQLGSPTYAEDLAEGALKLLETHRQSESPTSQFGVYHMTGQGVASWYQFAVKIFEIAGIEVEVTPITTNEYPTRAPRPRYSALDNAKLQRVFDIRLPSWEASTRHCIDRLTKAND